jgi:hypothetical protein
MKITELFESVNYSDNCPHCGGLLVDQDQLHENKDACYRKVKSRYRVWPSAYASSALVKCRKVGAANWGNKSKNESFDPEYDDESGMAQSNLHTAARAVRGLLKTIKNRDNLPEWAQEKIAKAEMMLVSVWDYLLSQKEQGFDPKISESVIARDLELVNEDLRKWFREKWVRFNPQGKIMGPCARGSKKEGKPKCLPQKKAQALGKKGRASAASRKRREDPNPERRGAAKNVATRRK